MYLYALQFCECTYVYMYMYMSLITIGNVLESPVSSSS